MEINNNEQKNKSRVIKAIKRIIHVNKEQLTQK